VRKVRVFVEGGGPHERTQKQLRRGFAQFLRLVPGLGVQLVQVETCGAKALSDFRRALRTNPEDLNLLLVDAEGPVTGSPKAHVAARVKTKCPGDESQYHLMVQAMEAWLVADVDALRAYYGPRLNENPLPKRPNVEEVAKSDLEPKLREATRDTQKGEYHKIRHAAPLLERLNAAKVRARAKHCERLFAFLEQTLSAPP
jgi:hypothetical protein